MAISALANIAILSGELSHLKTPSVCEFKRVVREKFVPACDAYTADPATSPASLRIKAVRGAAGLLEMTWSFASPDGRATFELVS